MLILAGLPLTAVQAAKWDEYRVVLKDGSWLTAAEKPETREDVARLRLPNGLLAVEDTDLIDWHKTRAWNFQAIYLRNVVAGHAPLGVSPLEGENPYGEAIVVMPDDGTGGEALEGPIDLRPLPDRETLMRIRVRELAEQIYSLKERKASMEKTAAASPPTRAVDLRKQAAGLDREIRSLRSEQAQLILQLPKR